MSGTAIGGWGRLMAEKKNILTFFFSFKNFNSIFVCVERYGIAIDCDALLLLRLFRVRGIRENP